MCRWCRLSCYERRERGVTASSCSLRSNRSVLETRKPTSVPPRRNSPRFFSRWSNNTPTIGSGFINAGNGAPKARRRFIDRTRCSTQRIETMAAPASHTFRNPQSRRGFSLLDLLITLLVLALVLLAAVKQFSTYQKPAAPPTPPAQSAPSPQQ